MHPVVLVPGFGGSLLVRKGREYIKFTRIIDNRWINLKTLTAPPSKRWREDMAYGIQYQDDKIIGLKNIPSDLQAFDIGGTKGIKDIIPEFSLLSTTNKHTLDTVCYYRYFHDICESLYEQGYVDHHTLFGLPYDFRLVLDPIYRSRIFDELAVVLHAGISNTGEKTVVVTHSIGGIMFKWFLSERPYYQDMIHQWISINTPFGGSTFALRTALYGAHYVPMFKGYVQEELSRNTGVILAFPNELAFHPYEPLCHITGVGTLTLSSYGSNNELTHATKRHQQTFKIWRDLYQPSISLIGAPVDVNLHAVISVGTPTPGMFTMKSSSTVNGDGTVPYKSLRVYERIAYSQDKLKDLILRDCDHTSPLMDARVIKLIKHYALPKPKARST